MSNLTTSIRSNVDPGCIVSKKLNKNGCRVLLTKAPKCRLILDFDKPGGPWESNNSRCDYLIALVTQGGAELLAPLELKRGQLNSSQIVKQLQAGASIAEKLISKKTSIDIKFRPIAATGGQHKAQRRKLKKHSIKFIDKKEPVRIITCGAKLIDALQNDL